MWVGAERKDARDRRCSIVIDEDAHAPEKLIVVVNACELVGARAAIPEEVGDQL